MKRSSTILVLTAMILVGTFLAGPAFSAAGDTLIVSDSYGLPGQGGNQFTVKLKNVTTIKGASFVIADLPDSLFVTHVDTTSKTANFRVDTLQIDGTLKVLMLPVDPSGDLITASVNPDGDDILTITVRVANGAPGGTTADLKLTNIKLANSSNLPESVAKKSGRFWFGKKLDVVYNGVIDLFDVLRIVDIALDRPPAPSDYEVWAADWDDDGLVTVVDIGEAMDQAVTPSLAAGMSSLSKSAGSIKISMPSIPANFTGKLDIPVHIKSSAALHGLQMTLETDADNFIIEAPKTTEATRGMKIVSRKNGKKMNILMCGLSGQAVPMGESIVMTLPVVVKKAVSEQSDITVSNALAGTENGGQLQTFFGQSVSESVIPETFALHQNSPNPFNMNTMITYDVPDLQAGSVQVSLDIFNTRGQLVKQLIDQTKTAGRYTVTWNGTDDFGRTVSTGVYFYRFKAQDVVLTKKLAVMK